MKNLLKRLSKLFEQKSPLESYILSKNPTTTYDVEYWSRRYSDRTGFRL
jgi:hypothetical protein